MQGVPIEILSQRLAHRTSRTVRIGVERYRRNEQALVLALMEMVVNGVSTRKVGRITEDLRRKAAVACLRHAQCQRTNARVERSFTVAVAVARPVLATLVPIGAEMLRELHLEHLVEDLGDQVAQALGPLQEAWHEALG